MEEKTIEYLLKNIRLPDPALCKKDIDLDKHIDIVFYIAKTFCPDFKISMNLKKIYIEAIKYFSGDKNSEWNIEKGLFVYGNIGTGKTLFFKIINQYIKLRDGTLRNGFLSISALRITQDYEKDGSDVIRYCGINEYDSRPPKVHLLIDDCGQHNDISTHFGSKRNVIAELLTYRYDLFISDNKLTHITTNLLPNEIEKRYGQHIQSRAKEMFNLIKFTGQDLRK